MVQLKLCRSEDSVMKGGRGRRFRVAKLLDRKWMALEAVLDGRQAKERGMDTGSSFFSCVSWRLTPSGNTEHQISKGLKSDLSHGNNTQSCITVVSQT